MKVGPYEVTLKESLTWGDVQEVQAAITAGAKIGATGLTGYDARAMLEAKYKLLEVAIVEIKEGDTVIKFSKEWMNALSNDDGNALYDAADALSKKK